MGYLTRFRATRTAGIDRSAFDAYLAAPPRYINKNNLSGSESVTWYTHDADIRDAMLASELTEVDLRGEGEEQGDVWEKEYRRVDRVVVVSTYRLKLTRDGQPDVIEKL